MHRTQSLLVTSGEHIDVIYLSISQTGAFEWHEFTNNAGGVISHFKGTSAPAIPPCCQFNFTLLGKNNIFFCLNLLADSRTFLQLKQVFFEVKHVFLDLPS